MAMLDRQNPVVDDNVLREAVTRLFMDDLKKHLMREAEGVVDATVEKLGSSIEIMAQNYINNVSEAFFPEYTVKAVVMDKREKK